MNSTRSFPRTGLRAVVLAFAVGSCLCGAVRAGTPDTKKTQDLINKKAYPSLWRHVSADPKVKRDAVWKLDAESDKASPFLICKHKQPSGYLRTKEEYTNYTLRLEFRYPSDPNCNSGILIHAGKDKIWPASIQVQLHRPFAGSIFPLKGAKTSNTVMRTEKKLDTGKWHTLRIDSINETVTVWINDGKVGEVNGCKPTKGFIALQSEGFEIHFRKMTVQDQTEKAKAAAKKTAGMKRAAPIPIAGTNGFQCPPTYGGTLLSYPMSSYPMTAGRMETQCRPCRFPSQRASYWRYDPRNGRYLLMVESSRDRSKSKDRSRSLPAFFSRNGVVYYLTDDCSDECDKDRRRYRKNRRRRRDRDDDDDDD